MVGALFPLLTLKEGISALKIKNILILAKLCIIYEVLTIQKLEFGKQNFPHFKLKTIVYLRIKLTGR